MSLQASWNSALGIVGGLAMLNKVSEEQKKTNETLSNYDRINAERAEENQRSIDERQAQVNNLNRRLQDRRAVYERIQDRRLGIGGSGRTDPATRITNQMAAQRAQEHIQQADTPRNSIEGVRQALGNDPMDALRNMTNEQMGAMDRMAQDQIDDMTRR